MTRFTTPGDDGSINASEAATALDAGILIAEPHEVSDGGPDALVYMGPDGKTHVVDLIEVLAEHQSNPARKTGTFHAHDADSFCTYMGKHGLAESEVWADAQGQRIVGVINAHDESDVGAGWGDHRVEYRVAATLAWKAWSARDGKLCSQTEFAEHIEDRMVDIVDPEAAILLELAETFEATNRVRFESSKILSSGQRQLTYKEQIEASAGRTGQLEIPKEFVLGLKPFEGSDGFKVTARLRYRINDGELRIGYKLVRPEDVLREAFDSVAQSIRENQEAPVFLGVSA